MGSHPGTGGAAVLADVLVAGSTDPLVQVDDCVLVEKCEFGGLRQSHQQPIGVVQNGQK